EAVLIELALLEVQEVVGGVVSERAAEAGAGLGLGPWQAAAEERVGGVQALVAEVSVDVAVESVGAATGNQIDVAAEGPAELGLATGGDHLELVHHVLIEEVSVQAGGIVIGREAVHDEAIGKVALAPDGNALAGHGRSFSKRLRAVGLRRGDAGLQKGQREHIPP